jgi:hypothetical protein
MSSIGRFCCKSRRWEEWGNRLDVLRVWFGLSNGVGLLSEEYDVRNRNLTGTIPQALTHLGLINTALFLSGPVIQRVGG